MLEYTARSMTVVRTSFIGEGCLSYRKTLVRRRRESRFLLVSRSNTTHAGVGCEVLLVIRHDSENVTDHDASESGFTNFIDYAYSGAHLRGIVASKPPVLAISIACLSM